MTVLLVTHLTMAFFLGLSDGLPDPVVYERADTAGQAPDESTRAGKAVELYRAQRLLEAAVAFEELWRDFRAPGYLFNAALARERVGHEALAYVHLRRFLTEQVGPNERATAERRLQDLRFRAVPVRIDLTGARPADKDLQFVAQRLPAGETITVEASLLAVADKPGTYEFYVEIGSWTITASASGYRAVEAAIEAQPATPVAVSLSLAEETVPFGMLIEPPEAVAAGVRVRFIPKDGGTPVESQITARNEKWQLAPGRYTVELSAPNFKPTVFEIQAGSASVSPAIVLQPLLAPPSAAATTTTWDRQLAIGLGSASAALLVGGVIPLVFTLNAYDERRTTYLNVGESRSPGKWFEAASNMKNNIRGQNAGFLLLGASVGGALGAGLTKVRGRRRVMMAEFGTGAVLFVGGMIAFGVFRGQFGADNRANDDFWRANTGMFASDVRSINKQVLGMGGAGLLAGTGAGLLASGIAEWALVHRRRAAPPVNVSANLHGHYSGLTISGRF